jgi:Cu(I)/Ag(I) efflux system membrane fusion protein
MRRGFMVFSVVFLVSGALGAGYWLGRQHDRIARVISRGNEVPVPLARASVREPLYYRDPMGLPDTSPTPRKDSMGMDYIPVYADEAPSAPSEPAVQPQPPGASQKERKVLYYKDPMGQPDTSPTPKKDSMGMDYIPVYEDEEGLPTKGQPPVQQAAPDQPPKGQGKILYYRNPMGLPDTSPTPKKDSMGMDYIPVYEGEGDEAGVIKISPAKIQRLGVRTEPAVARKLSRTVRAVGTVQADERKLYTITTKFEGYIEKLYVNATGQPVKRGEPLMEVYSPELVAAQQEYLLAWQVMKDVEGAGEDIRASSRQLADAALQRLRYWDISDDQLRRLRRDGKFARTLTVRSLANGLVLEKTAVEGMRFMPGEPLYKIADLSTVWLIAEVFEQDLASVHEGQMAKVTLAAYPGTEFTGKVAFIYPMVSRDTRTAKVRIEMANPDGRLKTDMYATVEIAAPLTADAVVAVPDSAVLNSGSRQAVLIDRGEGRFEPREVTLGARTDGYYQILNGVQPDEKVVVGANFLIDAESNLRAALNAFTPPEPQGEAP